MAKTPDVFLYRATLPASMLVTQSVIACRHGRTSPWPGRTGLFAILLDLPLHTPASNQVN
jgi:hypothetical protein